MKTKLQTKLLSTLAIGLTIAVVGGHLAGAGAVASAATGSGSSPDLKNLNIDANTLKALQSLDLESLDLEALQSQSGGKKLTPEQMNKLKAALEQAIKKNKGAQNSNGSKSLKSSKNLKSAKKTKKAKKKIKKAAKKSQIVKRTSTKPTVTTDQKKKAVNSKLDEVLAKTKAKKAANSTTSAGTKSTTSGSSNSILPTPQTDTSSGGL